MSLLLDESGLEAHGTCVDTTAAADAGAGRFDLDIVFGKTRDSIVVLTQQIKKRTESEAKLLPLSEFIVKLGQK